LKPAVGTPKKSIGLGRSCLRMKATLECKRETSTTTKDRGTLVTLTDISKAAKMATFVSRDFDRTLIENANCDDAILAQFCSKP
jgi:hypothetical protein